MRKNARQGHMYLEDVKHEEGESIRNYFARLATIAADMKITKSEFVRAFFRQLRKDSEKYFGGDMGITTIQQFREKLAQAMKWE